MASVLEEKLLTT